jgi:hypothetical protein
VYLRMAWFRRCLRFVLRAVMAAAAAQQEQSALFSLWFEYNYAIHIRLTSVRIWREDMAEV